MSRRTESESGPRIVVIPEAAIVQVTPPPLPQRVDAVTTSVSTGTRQESTLAGGHRLTIEVSDGTTLVLDGTTIIGRGPTHPEQYAHVIALPDQTRTLSRDHLEVGLTPAGQIWVSDQGSANGSYAARGRSWTRLPPHQRIPVDQGDVIRFADFSLRIGTEV